MSKVKDVYDKFWSEDRGGFESYIRNKSLLQFLKLKPSLFGMIILLEAV